MSQIFIAYSRKIRDLAFSLKDTLEEAGYDVWIDLEDLPAASSWRLEIQEAIEKSVAFIYLLSPDSAMSQYCQNEFRYARDLNKKIVPILLPGMKDSDIPSEIAEIQWLLWEDFEKDLRNTTKLTALIELDIEWAKFHAELTAKAKKRERTQDKGQLLRGEELKKASIALKETSKKPGQLLSFSESNFIVASMENEKKRKRRNRMLGWSLFTVVLIACCVAAVSAYYYFDRRPARTEVGEQSISIFNHSDYRFVTIDVGSTISAHSEPQKLTQHGPNLIIIGTGPDGSNPGSVLAYDMRGNLRWKHTTNNDPYGGPIANFSIRRIIVDEIMGDGEFQVIATSQKADWYPSELILLDAKGEQLGSHWNSGFIYDVLPQDFDGDGIKEIVVSSVNNNLGYVIVNDATKHPAIVYIISPKDGFLGQTFPDLINNHAAGTELNNWTAVLDPAEVLGIELRIMQEGDENLIEITTKPITGYIFLDHFGRIRQVGLSDYWRSENGDESPRDLICFLESKNDGWYFPEQVGQPDLCSWYGGE